MQVNLKVTAGPYKGRIFSFTQHDTFLIGRSPDAHLYLPDDRFFSRNHCLLEMNPPHSYLRDLGSTNGTFVNEQRLTGSFPLKDGDQVRFCDAIYKFLMGSNIETRSGLMLPPAAIPMPP